MNLSRIIYRLSSINPGIELLALFSWLLFFPKSGGKETSYLFFLGFAVLIVLFSLRQILSLKNIGLSIFSHAFTLFNLILILSIFFSIYYFRSIYFYADIFLVSFYAILFFFDRSRKDKYFLSLSYMISIFSIINIIHHFLPLHDKAALFFTNTIRQGIISGIAVLILLYYLLRILYPAPSEGADAAGKQQNRIVKFLILLAVNSAGVYVSRSKAAFIGIVAFGLLLFILKKKKLALIPVILAILTFILPNPVRDTFYYSLKKDPYAFDRVKIWQVPVAIFKDNLTGVGLDNFAEVSPTYNFKQTKGPANYFKVPRQPHNDYLKILAETGILGLITLLILLFFIFRKILSSSLFDITKILILYLMFQALLFNIIFHTFFFLLFVFLLKDLFERKMIFKSFSFEAKSVATCALILLLLICYMFPFLAYRVVRKAQAPEDPLKAAALMEKAAYFNPLNAETYQGQARIFSGYFRESGDIEYFNRALDSLKKAQRLNRYLPGVYLLESDLYYSVFKKFQEKQGVNYVSLEEIMSPLTKAEEVTPFDPFIKMHKAQAYLEFNENEAAKNEALKALAIEPHYISALYFLHRNFNYFGSEEAFHSKFNEVWRKIKGEVVAPGTYLYELFKRPANLRKF